MPNVFDFVMMMFVGLLDSGCLWGCFTLLFLTGGCVFVGFNGVRVGLLGCDLLLKFMGFMLCVGDLIWF